MNKPNKHQETVNISFFQPLYGAYRAGGAGAAAAAKAKSEAPLCERETNGTEEIK